MFDPIQKMGALILALMIALAACGSSVEATADDEVATLETTEPASSDDAETTSDTDATDTNPADEAEAAVLEFAECLRDEGFDVGDPTVNADGSINMQALFAGTNIDPGDDAVQAALEECSVLLEGVTLFSEDVDQTAIQDDLVEVAGCLRDGGYDVDDPDLSSGNVNPAELFGDNFDVTDPANQDALNECFDQVGFTPPGSGGN